MKNIKIKTAEVSNELMNELNQVLNKYNIGNVHIESIKIKEGNYQNCRKVCQIVTDPKTGVKKVICKTICD